MGIVFGVELPFNGCPKNACEHMLEGDCPVSEGEEMVYDMDIPIEAMYPTIEITGVLTAGKKLGTPTGTILFSLFLAVCLVLRILGGKPVEEPFLTSSLLRAIAYFILASFIYLV